MSSLGEAFGGAQIVLDEIARRVDDERFSVSFASLQAGPWPDTLRSAGMTVHVVDFTRLRDIPSLVRMLGSLRQIVRRDRIDLIHANESSMLFQASLLGRITGTRVVWHVYDPLVPKRASYRAMGMAWRALPPSGLVYGTQRAADHLRPWFKSVPSRVVLPGIDLERCRRGDAARGRKELCIPDDAPVVSTFGRLHPNKRQHHFVECVAEALETSPNLHGVICGKAQSGRYTEQVRELLSRLGLEGSVRITDFVPDGVRDDILAASDVVLHLARNESFGMAVAEAMAAGKPVVATDASGPASLITDNVTGLLIPTDDPLRASTELRRLLADPAERTSLGERAAAAAQDHSVDRMVRRVEDFWAELLAR